MKLSRSMAYAIQALLQLSRVENQRPVACNALARAGQMPERFLLQVLRNLVNHGLLKSTRGVEGGYILSRPPEEISLLHVYEAFDSPVISKVPRLHGLSDETRDRLLAAMNRAAALVRKELSQLSIADLAKRQMRETSGGFRRSS